MKGNATEILKQALIKAKEVGIDRALITCVRIISDLQKPSPIMVEYWILNI
jgi:hydroxyethylthiazole kinase-like sugar kinase family protein